MELGSDAAAESIAAAASGDERRLRAEQQYYVPGIPTAHSRKLSSMVPQIECTIFVPCYVRTAD